MPDFSYENQMEGLVAGIDEVGRGPLAGPVIAAACVFKTRELPGSLLDQINDSKKLTAKRREKVLQELYPYAHFSLGGSSVHEIDTLNIHQATLVAMKRAVQKLPLKVDAALVDGKFVPDWGLCSKALIKGDSLSLSISAASIYAKVARDTLMKTLDKRYPGYGWETNAGYGSKKHIEGIHNIGITPHHRRSFAPISGLVAVNS